jgi:LytR cell envelope-related transcriptional attenuator
VEHVHPLDRPFPWRTAALAAAALALAELTALLALAGLRLVHVAHRTTSTPAASTAPAHTAAAKPAKPVVHPLRPRSRVSVLVLNGNGIPHAAGNEASRLLARGYRHALPADAPTAYARSVVLFRGGWEREAQRLAHESGIRAAAPLDGRLPASDSGYQLVLILGAN